MNSPTHTGKILSVLLISFSLAGCSLVAPKFAAEPTLDIQPTLEAMRTQAVGTADAELTRQAPTDTPTAAETPTPSATPTTTRTPTPTRTRTPIPWTWTPTLPSGGCQVVDQEPDYGSSFLPDGGFDATWYIKNRSDETWYKDQVRVRYVSGTVMQTKTDEVELSGDLGRGATLSVTVDMQAPSEPGTYTTNWAVYRDQKIQCGLTLTIRVQQ